MDSDRIVKEIATLTEQGRWTAKIMEEVRKDVKELTASHNLLKLKVLTGSSIIAALTTYILRHA